MARPKKQSTIVPARWSSELKVKFLRYSFGLEPSPLKDLVKVRDNELSLRQWAENWGVTDTWIEPWAQDTLVEWREDPPNFASGFVTIARPRDSGTKQGFTFRVEDEIPDCRLALGVTVGGKLGEDEKSDDWERFCESLRKRLDTALRDYLLDALRSGALRKMPLDADDDLEIRLKVAAQYVFGKKAVSAVRLDRTHYPPECNIFHRPQTKFGRYSPTRRRGGETHRFRHRQ